MDPTYAEFGMVVAVLVILLGIASSVIGIVNQTRRKPSIEAEFATKAEMADLRHDIDRRLERMENTTTAQNQRIEALLQQHNRDGEDRIIRLHDRIDEFGKSIELDVKVVANSVSAIRARCAAFHGKGTADHD